MLFYKAWGKVIKSFEDYSTIASDANHPSFQQKGLKISTAKQVIQRLTITLAQVKAGNTSENVLNEIRQIIYFLYQAKDVTKKENKLKMSGLT